MSSSGSNRNNNSNGNGNGKEENDDGGDIYVPTLVMPESNGRVKELLDFFVENYLVQPEVVVRVPGRYDIFLIFFLSEELEGH